MSTPIYSLAFLEEFFVKVEASYGVMPTPVQADAVTLINGVLNRDQDMLLRKDKTGSRTMPQPARGGNIKGTVELDAYLIPSGVAGTAPMVDVLLTSLFGGTYSITTTVATGSTKHVVNVASATGIKAGTLLGIGNEIRPVASVNSNAVTMAVDYTADPTTATPVKAVNYDLADPTPASIAVFNYTENNLLNRVALGTVINKGDFNFVDQLLGVKFAGNAANISNTGIPTKPTRETVGLPVSRSFGKLFIGGANTPVISFEVSLDNGDVPRDIPIGAQICDGISRGLRKVTDNYTVYLRDDTDEFYTVALNRTPQPLFIQIGDTEGSLVGLWLPNRILQVPVLDKGKEEIQLTFTGNPAFGTDRNEFSLGLA